MILALFVIFLILFVILPIIGAALIDLLWIVITGLFIGAIARAIVPGRQDLSVVATIVIGFLGAAIGAFIGHGIHTGVLGRFLIELGVAAALVAVAGGTDRRRGLLSRSRGSITRW